MKSMEVELQDNKRHRAPRMFTEMKTFLAQLYLYKRIRPINRLLAGSHNQLS